MSYVVYCDKDGVLANFDKRVYEIFGQWPWEIGSMKKLWGELAKEKYDFYNSLEFMPDAEKLWNYIKPYNPIVITGCPMGNWAPSQKRRWVGRMLGWDVPVITCMAKEKYKWSGPRHILIDDRPKKSKESWEREGGIFITHENTDKTIQELKKLGL